MNRSIHEVYSEQLRRRFETLPNHAKNLIRDAHAQGIKWRGEDPVTQYPQLGGMSHFEHVVNEIKTMREEGADVYRKRALAGMERFASRCVVRHD